MSERYPEWCVDYGEGFGDDRFAGGYSEQTAKREAELNGAVARRCRRVKASEFVADLVDAVLDEADTAARGELPTGAWRNPDVTLAVGGPDIRAKFSAWLDANITVEAWICEGDEDA